MDTSLAKASYITSFAAIFTVIVCSIIVTAIMVKHGTFCAREWRVKTILTAYLVGGVCFCIYFFISRILETEDGMGVIVTTACAWTSVHLQVTVYYLRTAYLLKTTFSDE